MNQMRELQKAEVKLERMKTLFSDKGGRIIGVNKKRLYEGPFCLLTDPPNNSVAFNASDVSQPTTLRVSGEGPIQIAGLACQRTGACTVDLRVQDGSDSRSIMNNPCHIDAIFGSGGLPYPLPEALYVDENRGLAITFLDLSAGSNAVRVNNWGAKYTELQPDPTLDRVKQRNARREYLSLPYFYNLDAQSLTLASMASSDQQITIAADHHFEIHQISFVSTGSFSLNIVDLAKGESIINGPSMTTYMVPHKMLCGTNTYPFRLEEPYIVFNDQRLLVSIQDTSGASNRIWLTLGGRMIANRYNWQ